jgi:hypothetical protein
MTCADTYRLIQLIESDRLTIKTYCAIYPAVLVVAVSVSVYFHFHAVPNESLMQLAGLGISAIAAPMVPLHIKRAEALRMLNLRLDESRKLPPSDPGCVKISEFVDAIIRIRMGG